MRRFLDKLTGPPQDYQSIETLEAYRRYDVAEEAEQHIAIIDQTATVHGRHLWTSNDRLQISAASAYAALTADIIGDTMLSTYQANTQKPWPTMIAPGEYSFIEHAYGNAFSYIEAARETARMDDSSNFTVDKRIFHFNENFPQWPGTIAQKNTFLTGAIEATEKLHVWTSYRVEELSKSSLIPNEYRRLVAGFRKEMAKVEEDIQRIKTMWLPVAHPTPELLSKANQVIHENLRRVISVGMAAHAPSVLFPEQFGIKRPIVVGLKGSYSADVAHVDLPEQPQKPYMPTYDPDMRAYEADLVVSPPANEQAEATSRYNPDILFVPASATKAAQDIVRRSYSPGILDAPPEPGNTGRALAEATYAERMSSYEVTPEPAQPLSSYMAKMFEITEVSAEHTAKKADAKESELPRYNPDAVTTATEPQDTQSRAPKPYDPDAY